jgi:hypothetical protein
MKVESVKAEVTVGTSCHVTFFVLWDCLKYGNGLHFILFKTEFCPQSDLNQNQTNTSGNEISVQTQNLQYELKNQFSAGSNFLTFGFHKMQGIS